MNEYGNYSPHFDIEIKIAAVGKAERLTKNREE